MKKPLRAPVVLFGLVGLSALLWAVQLTGGIDGALPVTVAIR